MKKVESAAPADRETQMASSRSNGHSRPKPRRPNLSHLNEPPDNARWDFSVRLPGSWEGISGKIADTFNDIVAANQQMAQELKRVVR